MQAQSDLQQQEPETEKEDENPEQKLEQEEAKEEIQSKENKNNEEEKKDEGQDQIKEEKMKKLMEQIKLLMIVKLLRDDSKPNEVIPNLFIGSMGTAYSKENLKSNNIKRVLTVCEQKKSPFPDEFKYLKIEVMDSMNQSIVERFEESNKFIHEGLENDEGVFIHCFAGKSRSSSFLIAYLMAHKGMKLQEALELVKSKRPIVQPNQSKEQIKKLQHQTSWNNQKHMRVNYSYDCYKIQMNIMVLLILLDNHFYGILLGFKSQKSI